MKPLATRQQIKNKNQDRSKLMVTKKRISKKSGPRITRTIIETIANAQTTQPSAGTRRLPRQNRRNKLARVNALRRRN
ncbi:unnamed protein product (macronuclear) [Paramecium tetraurelia]|uniref:Uncharacterized protein n=1 Tax=Paramecium tetraurelia TaxID=5888 RepID=A0BUV8_PARTE|nr:uncharacterized protein GSPATT00005571001 [Paramecium tetraurelia]CAK62325.1 unnamed protein product [Paramecium tetraurelia]|eukprot:XP_001429723.1 hypothetical protein (macronuclear) [Paramecium tetraurelia strain d4-2]